MTRVAEVERDLSALESNFISSQPNMIIAAVELTGKIDNNIMSKSVTMLMQRYPSFRRNTASKAAPFRWVEVNKPADFRVVESDDWKSVMKTELRKHLILGPETLLWRATLVRSISDPLSHVLLFMYDHSIADGMSRGIWVNTLLNYYLAIKNGESFTVESLPALLSVVDHQRQKPNINIHSHEIETLFQDAKKHNNSWKSSLKAGRNEIASDDTNDFFCVDGDANNLTKLIETCRNYNTTVGIVLLTAAAWAMAKLERMHSPQKTGSTFSVDMNMDVDERKRVSPSLGNEHVQLFISMLPLKIEVNDSDSFWQSAARLREYVKARLPFTINYQTVLEKLEEIGAPYWKADANFSSMGRNPFPNSYGDLQIKSMHTIGSKWIPFFGRFVFLSQSVSAIAYDLVYESSDHEFAQYIMSMWSQLTEQAGCLNSDYSFTDFLQSKIEM